MIYGRSVLADFRCGVRAASVVVEAQPASRMKRTENDVGALQLTYEFCNTLQCCAKWIGRTNLRADVHADAVGLKPAAGGGTFVDAESAADVDAELVLAEAGGDVGVRFSEDVGVYAQGKARSLLEL